MPINIDLGNNYNQERETKNINIEDIISKYKDELSNYVYVSKEDVLKLPIGASICYFKKSNPNMKKKSGQIREFKNNDIIQLVSGNRHKIWFLYLDENYIFLKESNRNKLKIALLKLLDDDFSSLTIKTKTRV